jgi:KUP system potassium uptake protein
VTSGVVTQAPDVAWRASPGEHRSDAVVAISALGIVFGDIGTSPLYAFRESFLGHGHELAVT